MKHLELEGAEAHPGYSMASTDALQVSEMTLSSGRRSPSSAALPWPGEGGGSLGGGVGTVGGSHDDCRRLV